MGWSEGGWSGTRSASGGGGGDAFATKVIRLTLAAINGTNTITSITSIPSGAIVWECGVDVTTGFTAGTTISVGQGGGNLTEFQTTGDNTPAAIGLYQKFQDTTPAAASQVVVTVVSTTTTGAGFAYVRYSVPQS